MVEIEKSELALNGIDFKYSSVVNIEHEITESLNNLHGIEWHKLGIDDKVTILARSLSNVWKAHAFREGNTRTTVMFYIELSRKIGVPFKEEILTSNSEYLRRALVASAYEDKELGISRNFYYLNRIIKDSIESYGEKNINRKTSKDR